MTLRFVLILLSTALGIPSLAQEMMPVAPVPPALYIAKKVFIANAGADSGLFPHPFSGEPDRAYNEFYAGVKAMSRLS